MHQANVPEAPLAVPPAHQPYVGDDQAPPELTWPAVAVGSILGIIFGASSLYLVLKVGMTVSASIPVAVLSITLFRAFSAAFGIRRATILENNVVQTTGSAGESIAFGIGVTIPALLLLGFEMELVRVMSVGLLGGLLGILMMIPLRRAFIVAQHGRLLYPEGTACAEVLIVGEKGGATAATVFFGFFVAFAHKFSARALHLWKEIVELPLFSGAVRNAEGEWIASSATGKGLKGAILGGELAPELLGVGYIIGPRIASIMFAGGALAYLVLAPTIVLFGAGRSEPLPPATSQLIGDMTISQLRNNYILYIGAGAVATGGIISMLQALPLILGSLRSGLRDVGRGALAAGRGLRRTERDLSLKFVLGGTLALVLALAAVPSLGLGFTPLGVIGAVLIVVFGFLFVSVSSRLTGEIGSSSNPISGMTVATLLLTCLVFLALGMTTKAATLTALTVAAVVCVAASNGGTTSQDLKTGFLVGATPRAQQIAILIGALTSALVIGVTLLVLNHAGTIYSKRPEMLPDYTVPDVAALTQRQQVGGQYAGQDEALYHVLLVGEGEIPGVPQGKYLVDDEGRLRYLVDPGINGRLKKRDDGTEVTAKFDAPKTRLMALIIDGILNRKLPWELVLIGVLSAVTLELAGVPSLPFAVGIYLPISASSPIFVGGMVRWLVDRLARRAGPQSETSPGVLLCSGYIAGGAIAGVLVSFFTFLGKDFEDRLSLRRLLWPAWNASDLPAVAMFALLVAILLVVALRRNGAAEAA